MLVFVPAGQTGANNSGGDANAPEVQDAVLPEVPRLRLNGGRGG